MNRVGVLAIGGPGAAQGGEYIEHWKAALRSLGYVEGRDLAIEVRWANGHAERLPSLASELVAWKPDVVFAPLVASARAMREATKEIPIVTASVDDPVAERLVESLGRPGTNVTGVSNMNRELRAKAVELAHLVAPSATRIGILLGDRQSQRTALDDFRGAAAGLKLETVPLYAASPQELEAVFAALPRDRLGAVIVVGGPFLYANAQLLVGRMEKARMPAIYPFDHYVEKGGLMSYGANLDDQYELAAKYVDRVLKGSKPQDLPVQQPTKIDLAVNLRAAEAIGLAIPRAVLLRSDRTLR